MDAPFDWTTDDGRHVARGGHATATAGHARPGPAPSARPPACPAGAPLEESKRKWVPVLLHISTLPILSQFVFAAYGTAVVRGDIDSCWPVGVRQRVHAVARVLVYSTWGLVAIIG